jgi:hypothetical protein
MNTLKAQKTRKGLYLRVSRNNVCTYGLVTYRKERVLAEDTYSNGRWRRTFQAPTTRLWW